jgi:trk system potassium uptake protein TrkA
VKEELMARSYAVLGLSTFGYQMAVNLKKEGAQVLVIDADENVIQKISDYVTKAVVADLSNEKTLRTLGVFDVDAAIISMPDHFDITVLVAHSLKREGVAEILAQVESEAQAGALEAVGATRIVFPERDIAERTVRELSSPTLADRIPLGRDVSIIEAPCPLQWDRKSLIELRLRTKFHVYVIGIKKKTAEDGSAEKIDILPVPDHPLRAGDILLVLGRTDHLEKFKKAVSSKKS